MRGISRAESKRSQGWLVRIYRGGKTISKFFSYRKYGGKGRSLQIAREHLAKLERQHPPYRKPPFRQAPLPTNKTGVNGVCLTYHRDRHGAKLHCYSVHYRLEGQVKNKRFYLHWYGNDEMALREAALFRKEMEELMLREWKRKKR